MAIRHKPQRERIRAGPRWAARWLGWGGGGSLVVEFKSESSERVPSDERRRVDGAVMEDERREDDMTSYLKRSENS